MDDPRFLLIEGFRWISFGIEMTHGLPAAPGTGLQGPNWVPLSMRAEASFSRHGAYFFRRCKIWALDPDRCFCTFKVAEMDFLLLVIACSTRFFYILLALRMAFTSCNIYYQYLQDRTFAQDNTQNDDGGLQSAALATKNATHLLQNLLKYCACPTKRF